MKDSCTEECGEETKCEEASSNKNSSCDHKTMSSP